MKKLFTLITFVIFCNVFIYAQPLWNWQNPSPQGNYLYSVDLPTNNIGFAVGDYGTIIKTIDAGTTWTVQVSGTSENLRSVNFVNSITGYAVGESGIILKTIKIKKNIYYKDILDELENIGNIVTNKLKEYDNNNKLLNNSIEIDESLEKFIYFLSNV